MIRLTNLEKRYPLQAGFFARNDRFVYAVNGVSLTIADGEVYGLVGEWLRQDHHGADGRPHGAPQRRIDRVHRPGRPTL